MINKINIRRHLQLKKGSIIAVVLGSSLLAISFYPTSESSPSYSETAAQKTAIAKTINHLLPSPPSTDQLMTVPKLSTLPVKTTVGVSHSITVAAKPAPVVVPSPQSSVSGLTPVNPTSTPSSGSSGSSTSGSGSGQTTTTGYTSTNWSGYMATTGSFSQVSASWTVTRAVSSGDFTSADATWIGIGGVSSNDLIQVGTQNIISASGQVSTSAFYEMLPASAVTIPNFSVSAGDNMSASLSEIASGEWVITINDQTTGQSFTDNVAYNSSLSSAEWIEEDPSYSTGRLIALDDFGSAAFTDGSATNHGTSLSIAGNNAQPITLLSKQGQVEVTPSDINSDNTSFGLTQQY